MAGYSVGFHWLIQLSSQDVVVKAINKNYYCLKLIPHITHLESERQP